MPENSPSWTSTGHPSIAFKGLFTNPVYEDVDLFCQQDAQTRHAPEILKLAALVNNNRDLSSLAEIYALVHAVAPIKRDPYGSRFTTTASQILTRGFANGCTNYAIAYATLARTKGIPAIVVDSASYDWIRKGCSQKFVSGHFFVEALINNRWLLVDSTKGELSTNYDPDNWFLPDGLIAFTKALSVIDTGSNEGTHNLLQAIAFWKNDLVYSAPNYKRVVLRDVQMIDKMKAITATLDLSQAEQPTLGFEALPTETITGTQAILARGRAFKKALSLSRRDNGFNFG